MPAAGECIHEVARHVVTTTHWLNADLFGWATYGDQSIQLQHSCLALAVDHPDKLRIWMPVASWGPLPRAAGEAGRPHLAGAEGIAWRHLEDRQIHGVFPVTCYAGHTRTERLVEGHAEGTARAPGNAHWHPTVQAYVGRGRHVCHAQIVGLLK